MKNIQSNHIEFIKWVAIITMTIDHVGKIIFNADHNMTAIGRIAFPLFSFLIAYNYLYNTSNKFNYIKRLLIFALVSQPIFLFALGAHSLNIMFTLASSLSLIFLLDHLLINTENKFELSLWFILFVFAISILGFFVDYGHLGVLLTIVFYSFLKTNNKLYLLLTATIIYTLNLDWDPLFSLTGLLAFAFIFSQNLVVTKKINKFVYYIYYPAHLFVIKGLSFLFSLPFFFALL